MVLGRQIAKLLRSESVWLVVMRGVFAVVAFATLLVLRKALGPSEFGFFVTVNAFVMICLGLGKAGFGKIVIREAQRDDMALANGLVKGLALWSLGVFAALVLVVGFYVSWDRLDAVALFVFWAVPLHLLNVFSTLLLSAHERVRARISLFLIYPLLVLAGVVALAATGRASMELLVWVYGGAGTLALLISLIHVAQRTAFRVEGIAAAGMRFHADTLGMGVANLLQAFAAALPVLYVSTYVDLGLAGDFRLVMRAAEFILIFPQLLENIGEPVVFRNAVHNARNQLAEAVARMHGHMIAAAVAGLAGIVVALHALIALGLAPDLFRQPGFYILAAFCTIAAWVGPGTSISTAYSKQRVLIAGVVGGLAIFFALMAIFTGRVDLEILAVAHGLLVLSTKLVPAAYVRWKGYVPARSLPTLR